MTKPPLRRHRNLYKEKGVSKEELMLNDIIQSFDGRGLRPTIAGPGHPSLCTACAVTALYGREDRSHWGVWSKYYDHEGGEVLGWDGSGWDGSILDHLDGDDLYRYTAGECAWYAMHNRARRTG